MYKVHYSYAYSLISFYLYVHHGDHHPDRNTEYFWQIRFGPAPSQSVPLKLTNILLS